VFLLRAGHLRQSFGQPPAGATQDGNRHLQVALQGHRRGTGARRLALRFQKQFRLGEHARANYPRAVPPDGIELPGLPRVATMLDEGGGHPLAVLHVDARHRHQILHRQLRRQLAFAHLLLDGFRQHLHQPQATRYPTHAAVEAPPQLFQRVAEALLHLRQQPALFQRALLWTEAQRAVQQQRFGFTHRPHGGLHCVPAQLLERGDALVAVDHQVALAVLRREDHDDRRLLARLSQRRHQAPLPVRLADSQMLPPPVELVKLQLHGRRLGDQYGPSAHWSFAAARGVCWEVLQDQ
jgi:hypothetical protein